MPSDLRALRESFRTRPHQTESLISAGASFRAGCTVLVNESRVREALSGYRLNHKFTRALEERLLALMEEAKRRAEENGRRTIYPHDL